MASDGDFTATSPAAQKYVAFGPSLPCAEQRQHRLRAARAEQAEQTEDFSPRGGKLELVDEPARLVAIAGDAEIEGFQRRGASLRRRHPPNGA